MSDPRDAAALSPERWKLVDAILQAALDRAPAGRRAFIAEACRGDRALQGEVESLLAAHVESGDEFLERPAQVMAGGASARALADALEAYDARAIAKVSAPDAAPSASHPSSANEGHGIDIARHDATHLAARVSGIGRLAAVRFALVMLVVGFVAGVVADRMLTRVPRDVAARVQSITTAPTSAAALMIVDRSGRPVRAITAQRPWAPRFSPDGRRIAFGAFSGGRESSDLWVADAESGATQRITSGDDDANDPQWSRDGASLAYSANAPDGKDVMLRRLDESASRALAVRPGGQFPSDWLGNGKALLVTEDPGGEQYDIIVQPTDGSPAHAWLATSAKETAARISADGKWIAYTSDVSGRAEVYLDSYPAPGHRVRVSTEGGIHPVWRGDGRELFFWHDGALIAVPVGVASSASPPAIGAQVVLFRAAYPGGINAQYDVSPDGQRFVIAR